MKTEPLILQQPTTWPTEISVDNEENVYIEDGYGNSVKILHDQIPQVIAWLQALDR